MKKHMIPAAVLIGSAILSGCQSTGTQNEQAGVLVGAVVGGLLGSEMGSGRGKTAAVMLGTMIGSHIGGNIGRTMDDTDRLITAHSLETVRTGVPTSWRNPDTENNYSLTPTRTFETSGGPCREYTVDAIIGGKTEQITGTACRQTDGSWKTL